ncbi:MAG: hypothetical protein JO303_10550 [Caulobacteraceae bacterium]|nr:hypothetical protein [Caulobacteraceae bacterium]
MPRIAALISLIAAALGCIATAALADDDDYPTWQPSSDAAVAITGPVILFPDRFNAGQANFPWQEDGVAPQFKPDQGPIPARIFKLAATPAAPVLLNGARLCGDTAVKWIVMVPAPPNGLEIDAYGSDDKPASISSPGRCGTFDYRRW